MDDPNGYITALDRACIRAEGWFQALPTFPLVVNERGVVGFERPALLSEEDCVLHLARFLAEQGVEWEAMHLEISKSRWLFAEPHPEDSVSGRWSVDLVLVNREDLRGADLPARSIDGFRFDVFVEVKFFHAAYGGPNKVATAARMDVAKVARYLDRNLARAGYAVFFVEADYKLDALVEELQWLHDRVAIRIVRAFA